MAITVYGIANCDQIKKTLAWFAREGVPVEFHDYKKAGVDARLLAEWFARADWSSFVNRAGTTWRRLPDAIKANVTSAAAAIPVLVANPSAIKRPVVVAGKRLTVGYDPATFAQLATER
jgi:arsenate reductase (glutaredoxin)